MGRDLPDAMAGRSVVSAPKGSGGDAAVKALMDRFATDPNWNGGWHYERGGVLPTLLELRIETLTRHGQNEALARTIADPGARAARPGAAEFWASADPNSMVTLLRGGREYDAECDFSKDPREGALRVRDRQAVSAVDRAGGDEQARQRRRGRPVLRDRHRVRPFGQRPEWAKWAPRPRTSWRSSISEDHRDRDHPAPLPFTQPFRISARGRTETLETLVVRVHTTRGSWGSANPGLAPTGQRRAHLEPGPHAKEHFEPLIAGARPFDVGGQPHAERGPVQHALRAGRRGDGWLRHRRKGRGLPGRYASRRALRPGADRGLLAPAHPAPSSWIGAGLHDRADTSG